MKRKNIINVVVILLLYSCNSEKIEIIPLDTITYSTPNTKVEYFEIANYNSIDKKKLIKTIINYNNRTIEIDSVKKHKRYYRYFYEKHFYINYLNKYDSYNMDGETTTFDGMDGYILSFARYTKIDSLNIEKKVIVYKNSLKTIEFTDTISFKK